MYDQLTGTGPVDSCKKFQSLSLISGSYSKDYPDTPLPVRCKNYKSQLLISVGRKYDSHVITVVIFQLPVITEYCKKVKLHLQLNVNWTVQVTLNCEGMKINIYATREIFKTGCPYQIFTDICFSNETFGNLTKKTRKSKDLFPISFVTIEIR